MPRHDSQEKRGGAIPDAVSLGWISLSLEFTELVFTGLEFNGHDQQWWLNSVIQSAYGCLPMESPVFPEDDCSSSSANPTIHGVGGCSSDRITCA